MIRSRLILGLAVPLVLLSGHASARPKKKPPATPPAEAPVQTAPVPAPPPAPAVPSLATLISASDDDVKTKLGVPDIARREGASAMWTYAWPDCALMVFFRSPDGRTLRVSGASAGPRRRGQQAPTVDACIAGNRERAVQPDDGGAIDALLAAPG
jgi:hypothetical protein